MTRGQRKYLEGVSVLILLVVTVWYFQDDEVIARLAFVPAVIYYLINYREIRAIEQVGPSPKKVIEDNRFIRGVVTAILAIEIFVAYWSLISGFRIDGALQGFGVLLLAILGPLLPAVVVSQLLLFKRLSNESL